MTIGSKKGRIIFNYFILAKSTIDRFSTFENSAKRNFYVLSSKRKKRINDSNFRCYKKKKKKFDHAVSNVCAYRNRFHGCLYPITLNVLTSKSYFPTLSKITILLIDNKRRSYNVSTFIAENCEHARSIEHSKVLSNHFSPLRRVVTISIRGIYFSGKQRDGEAVAG